MCKKYFILTTLLLIFALAQGQQVESKKCKTCGKPLKECQYKGKHPNRTSAPKPSKPKIESKYLRMDGNDIVFDLNGTEYRYRMVYVSGGTYRMGAQKTSASSPNYDPDARDSEGPVHSVTVGSFYMGETEVTQALWKAVMGSNPSNWKRNDLPVESVSYNDVQEFIRKLNNLTGATFRLPTEEEWEYAARGGSNSRGYKYSGDDDIGSVAWYYDNSGYRTHPVRQKRANELGLYDMSGNVCEWCSSLWCRDYNSGRSDFYRVFRGGDWGSDAEDCSVSCRDGSDPPDRWSSSGFRLAR